MRNQTHRDAAIAVVFLFGVLASTLLGYVPRIVPIGYALMSFVTFAAYALDKAAAMSGRWRISERTLHVLGLLGGWPGALLAQQKLRHKTRKASFQAAFWLTVVVNGAFFAWLHTDQGRSSLGRAISRLDLSIAQASPGRLDAGDAFIIARRTRWLRSDCCLVDPAASKAAFIAS